MKAPFIRRQELEKNVLHAAESAATAALMAIRGGACTEASHTLTFRQDFAQFDVSVTITVRPGTG